MKSDENLSKEIKRKALEIGFNSCGISQVTLLEEPAKKLKIWLDDGYHANMKYMENHFEKRINPTKLVDGAKSVISVILNYYPDKKQPKNTYQLAKCVYGEDYHIIMKKKLKELLNFIKKINPDTKGRTFVDSAPVLEKEWARRAGLGWIGKNSLLINKELGSFVFIGELIINLELEYDTPISEYCGSCTRCIEACPTGAILNSHVIDSNKCISYQTIENKVPVLSEHKSKFYNYIFGCDICQDVCPWNKKIKPTKEKAFKPDEKFLSLSLTDFENMEKSEFDQVFKRSALKRAGYKGLKKNIEFIRSNKNAEG